MEETGGQNKSNLELKPQQGQRVHSVLYITSALKWVAFKARRSNLNKFHHCKQKWTGEKEVTPLILCYELSLFITIPQLFQ